MKRSNTCATKKEKKKDVIARNNHIDLKKSILITTILIYFICLFITNTV